MDNPPDTFGRNFDILLASGDGFVLGSMCLPDLAHWLVAGEYQSARVWRQEIWNNMTATQTHKHINDKACFMKMYCTI